jgi:hypothetical protein
MRPAIGSFGPVKGAKQFFVKIDASAWQANNQPMARALF